MSVITWFSTLSVLLPLAAGLSAFGRSDRNFRLLALFFGLVAIVETGNRVLVHNRTSNYWLINIFILVETVTFLILLGRWRETKNATSVALIASAVYTALWFYFLFVQGRFDAVNNYAFTASALLLVAFSGLTLYRLSGEISPPLFRNPRFWVAAGILILYSVDTVIFSLMDIVTQRGDRLIKSTWVIHSVFNILANGLYAIGFICILRREK